MASPLRARVFRTLAALLLLTALLVPGAAPALAADGEPLVLRAGTDQDLQVLNPFNSVVVADFEVFTLNYDTLVGWGQNIEPVEGFAESWEQSADGLTWTFRLRPGVTFSDGTPLTAAAAARNFERWLSAEPPARYVYWQTLFGGFANEAGPDGEPLSLVQGVTTRGDDVLVLALNRPAAYLPNSASSGCRSTNAEPNSNSGPVATVTGACRVTNCFTAPSPCESASRRCSAPGSPNAMR